MVDRLLVAPKSSKSKTSVARWQPKVVSKNNNTKVTILNSFRCGKTRKKMLKMYKNLNQELKKSMNKVIYKPKKRIYIEKCCFFCTISMETMTSKNCSKYVAPCRIDKICHTNNQYEKQY